MPVQAEDIDFLIIGAAKSATTWLQKALQADPAVSMPDPELHYFSRFHDRGDTWYLDQFSRTESTRLVGEKSNSYLDDPAAPARVEKLLPHAKLIVQLRNPVERAYSDYCMLFRRGEVGKDIGAHLHSGEAGKRFLLGGRYFEQLERYRDRYPDNRILALLFEDMLSDPADQLRRARGFLDLPMEAPRQSLSDKVKDRTEPMIGPRLRKALKPFKPLVRPFRGNPAFVALRRAVAREISYPPLTPELRSRLADFYADDVTRLGTALRRDLSGWLRAEPAATALE